MNMVVVKTTTKVNCGGVNDGKKAKLQNRKNASRRMLVETTRSVQSELVLWK